MNWNLKFENKFVKLEEVIVRKENSKYLGIMDIEWVGSMGGGGWKGIKNCYERFCGIF